MLHVLMILDVDDCGGKLVTDREDSDDAACDGRI